MYAHDEDRKKEQWKCIDFTHAVCHIFKPRAPPARHSEVAYLSHYVIVVVVIIVIGMDRGGTPPPRALMLNLHTLCLTNWLTYPLYLFVMAVWIDRK